LKTAANKIRVLIADDHKIVRAGLTALLGTEPDIAVIGLAVNGKDAIAQVKKLRPDVVIMDLMMPVMDGAEATEVIHHEHPDVRIVVLTTFGTSDGIAHALNVGACGALMKNAEEEELSSAIRAAVRGERRVSAEIELLLQNDPPAPELTPRQKSILDSMIRGLTNHDIAQQLSIRQDGVKDHINAIFTKLGAANRAEAVAIALRKHLLKI